MICQTSQTTLLPRNGAGPPPREDQLGRLVAVYRAVGLDQGQAQRAAVSDLTTLFPTDPPTPTDPGGPTGGAVPAPPRGLVVAAFAAIYLIWGSTFLGIRYAVTTVPPFLMAGGRFGLAGLLLYAWARGRGAAAPTWGQWRDAIIVGTCLLVIGNGGVTWSELVIPSGVAALIVALIPLWMVIFDWLRPGGVRPRPLVFLGLAAGFGGVALLAKGHQNGGSSAQAWGVAALVVASMSWAAGSLFNRRARKPSSPLLAVAIQMIAGGALLCGVGLALGEASRFSVARLTALSVGAWVYLSLIGSLIGYTAYVWLLQVSTPARVATYAYVNPLIAVLLGCTLGREPVSHGLLLAAVLIVVAVGLIVRGGARRAPVPWQKQK